MGSQGVGNEGDARHLHGQRAGIDAGGLAAERSAVQQGDVHATPRAEEGGRCAVNATADHREIVHVAHNGAGLGMGMSA